MTGGKVNIQINVNHQLHNTHSYTVLQLPSVGIGFPPGSRSFRNAFELIWNPLPRVAKDERPRLVLNEACDVIAVLVRMHVLCDGIVLLLVRIALTICVCLDAILLRFSYDPLEIRRKVMVLRRIALLHFFSSSVEACLLTNPFFPERLKTKKSQTRGVGSQ